VQSVLRWLKMWL